jgi:predicted metalloprotease with PDZ domain
MSRKFSFLILAALLLAAGSAVIAADTSEKSEKSEKKESRAFLGVFLDDVTSDIASDYGVTQGQGALVRRVSQDSPAEKAGLRANDVIVKLGDTAVKSADDLREMLHAKKAGDVVQLTVVRGGEEKTIEATLGKRPRAVEFGLEPKDIEKEFKWVLPQTPEMPEPSGHAWAGIRLQELSEGLAKYFGVEDGVLISDVEKDSPAEKAGLEAGDVIVRIDGRSINDPQDVQRRVGRHDPGETAKFEVVRKGASKTIDVELGEAPRGSVPWGLRQYQYGPFPGRGCGIFRNQCMRELPGKPEGSMQRIDRGEIRAQARDLQKQLQPQMKELKKQLRELQKQLQQLKEEESRQQKM